MSRFLADIEGQPESLRSLVHGFPASRPSIEAAAGLLRRAKRIVVTSMGSAFHSAAPMATALGRYHPAVHLIETSELLQSDANFPDTVTIVVSRSGESGEVESLAKRPRSSDHAVIAITMTEDSSLAKCADAVIHVPVDYDGFICTKAYTSLMLVGLWLATAFIGESVSESDLMTAIDEMERRLPSMAAQIAELDWLTESSFVYFLSDGVGKASARMGALLLEEGARRPAGAYSSAMFRHGPIEVVEAGIPLVWIDLDASARSTSRYREIRRLTDQIVVVSTDSAAYPGCIEVAGISLPSDFRPVFAAPSIQLIAYTSGKRRGHEPGVMRYVDWVVK